jgi:hypothetical protein
VTSGGPSTDVRRHVVRAEWRKVAQAKSTWVLVIAAGLAAGLAGAVNTFHARLLPGVPAGTLVMPATVGEVFAAILSVLVLSAEDVHRTWTTTLAAVPGRAVLLGAKWSVGLTGAAAFAVVSLSGCVIGVEAESQLFPVAGHVSMDTLMVAAGSELLRITVAVVVVASVWMGVATIWPNRSAVLAMLVAWELAAANLLALSDPGVARWVPEGIVQAIAPPVLMVNLVTQTDHGTLVSMPVAAVYLASLLGILAAVGAWRFVTREDFEQR